jgi:hypothetical protein
MPGAAGTYHDLRAEHTAWVQRIHAVFFHQGAPALGEAALRTERDLQALRTAAAAYLSRPGSCRWSLRWPCSPSWRSSWRLCGTGWWTPPGT